MKRLGKSYITSLYRSGFDEISLNYDDNDYIKVIQDLISKEIMGFEMIKQGNNYCLIKDLTGHNKDEFDNALRRIWLLTLDLSKESLSAIGKDDVNILENVRLIDYNINKFSNYCLRLLTKRGHADFRKTPLYYHLIKSLEEIADQYKDLCSFYLDNKNEVDKDVVVVFEEINNHLNEFHELFYKYDEQRIENLFRETKLTDTKMSKLKGNMIYCLSSICKNIRNLLSVLIEINL